MASDMICFSTLPGVCCHFCKSGKRKCQYSVKTPCKLGKVEAKVPEEKVVKVEKSKEKPKAVPKKIVAKSSAPLPLQSEHKPPAVAGPSQFTGLMPAGVRAVQVGVASPSHFHTSVSLRGEEIPCRYTRGWDFEVVGEDEELSLEVIRSRTRALTHQIAVLKIELHGLAEMEEAMFDARLEAGKELEDGEFDEEMGGNEVVAKE
jgi:hypothetical protein